ncbi:MAG TPA: histidinol-phosphate transaminase [Terriglobales bacterium]
MSDFSRLVPNHILRLVRAGESRPLKQPSGASNPVLLNLNENPFGPSPLAIRALQCALADVNRYPEIQALDLHQEIASFHNVKPEQVLVTAGATDLIGMVGRALLGPGLNAVTSERSFIVYRLATRLTEGKLIEVPMRNDGYDLEAIAKSIDRNTRIVFIANPNNPTGSLLAAAELDGFLQQLPDHVLLVIDEAYGDFASEFIRRRRCAAYSRSLEYVSQDRNIIVLKTFSKTHGLAGLRVGYGIGPARLVALFAPLRTIFSLSSLAQIAAAAALRDSEHIQRAVKNNAEEAEALTGALTELGWRLPQTWANFLYLELGQDAAAFADRLRERGVVVQPLGLWGAPTAIRISIGTPEQNQQFLRAMSSLRH